MSLLACFTLHYPILLYLVLPCLLNESTRSRTFYPDLRLDDLRFLLFSVSARMGYYGYLVDLPRGLLQREA